MMPSLSAAHFAIARNESSAGDDRCEYLMLLNSELKPPFSSTRSLPRLVGRRRRFSAAGRRPPTARPTAWRSPAALTSPWSARWSEPAGAAIAHGLELIPLLGGQDLRELGVDFLLKVGDLFLLFGGQVQPLPQHGGQDLTRARRASHSHWRATRATAGWSETGPAATDGRLLSGCQRGQLLLRDNPVLIGVGSLDQPMQPLVGHFGLGQLPVFVFVEFHHPRHEVVGPVRPLLVSRVASARALRSGEGRGD
jgi:hypothetical protein